MKKTAEDKIKICQKICDYYSTGKYTIESCCKKSGVAKRTFDNWVEAHAEIAGLYKKASDLKTNVFKKHLKKLTETAIEKKLKGWKWVETTKENGIITKEVTKFQVPDTALLIFNICNLDPENWKNKQEFDHTTKGESLKTIEVIIQGKNSPLLEADKIKNESTN